MPRFYVEPRPYCLIRAQKQNPFFLARAAAISLYKFRRLFASSGHSNNASSVLPLPPPQVLPLPLPLLRCRRRCFFFSLRLPASPPLETTTRASYHRRLVSRPATTTRDHHASPLSPSRLASGHDVPTSRPSLCLSASVPTSLHHHANIFVLLPQLSRHGFLSGKFRTHFCLIFCFCVC